MEKLSTELMEKYNKLKDIISGYKSVAVAFSSGVDSCIVFVILYPSDNFI